MKLESIYILRAPHLTRMVWKPCILTSSHQIMAKAILAEQEAALVAGRQFNPSSVIRRFQCATGGLRLTDAEALDLLITVAKAIKQEEHLAPAR